MGPGFGPASIWPVAAAFALFGVRGAAVAAWSPMLEISHASSNERSTPRIVYGASGNLYVAYINKGSPWRVYFRQKSPPGNWGPIEMIPSPSATRPDVVEDGQGRPHVLFAASGTAGAYDLMHAYKDEGTWNVSFITSTTQYDDQPHLATDSQGRIHMAFTRTNVESSSGDLVYLMWNGSSWVNEKIIGHVTQAYFHRPSICVDASDNVHVCWVDKINSVYKVRYCRLSSGTWSGILDVGSGADGASYFNYAKIAAPTPNNIMVVWHDDASNGSFIVHNYSNNGGANWAFGLSGSQQGQTLYPGHYPSIEAAGGAAHVISNQEPTEKVLVYSRWNGSTWTTLQEVVASNTFWKGWPDIAVDGSGYPHVVWDEPYGPDTWQHYIAYSTVAPETVPPAKPANFTATARHNRVSLSWTNPADPDFQRTIIRVSTTGYPQSVNAGTLLADRPAAPGSTDAVEHTVVTNGVTYYYAAFSKDVGGLYSTAAPAVGTPYVPPDLDRDGDVDMSDFAKFQLCMSGAYIPQTDPNCAQALFDADSDVDPDDVAMFLGCMNGAQVPYLPGCAN